MIYSLRKSDVYIMSALPLFSHTNMTCTLYVHEESLASERLYCTASYSTIDITVITTGMTYTIHLERDAALCSFSIDSGTLY